MSASKKSVSTLSDTQLERKRANDREAQRIIRQRTREHIENLERQVAELGEAKEQLGKLERQVAELSEVNGQLGKANSGFKAQIATLQWQIAQLLQDRQSLGYVRIAQTYGINNYIAHKILSKRNANRGVDQNATTETIFATPYQYTPETNNRLWATQRPGTSQPLSNGGGVYW
jgi:hypothetical protein